MKRNPPSRLALAGVIALVFLCGGGQRNLLAKEKDRNVIVDPNDVTLHLFQLLDETHDGKLKDYYILGDVYKDKNSKDPSQELQHVLLVDYDKNRNFGKLNIHVRSLAKLDPAQLKTYTLKQIYDFGIDDTEKFVKSEPGEFGRTGDLYLHATADSPITDEPITEDARKAYEFFVTQYILPSLQKK